MFRLKGGSLDSDSLIDLQNDSRHALACTRDEANGLLVPFLREESRCQSCFGLAVLIQEWRVDDDSVELSFELRREGQGFLIVVEFEVRTYNFESLVVF